MFLGNIAYSLPREIQLLVRDTPIGNVDSVVHTQKLTKYLDTFSIDVTRHQNKHVWCKLAFQLLEKQKFLSQEVLLLKVYKSSLAPINNVPLGIIGEILKSDPDTTAVAASILNILEAHSSHALVQMNSVRLGSSSPQGSTIFVMVREMTVQSA